MRSRGPMKPGGPDPRNPALARELERRLGEDFATRDRLAATGALYEGYHPEMAAVHQANMHRLAAILAEHGWPGVSLVGARAEEAAWIIAQHAIGHPAFQRNALALVRAAAERGEAPLWQVAHLEDRIRSLEGRGQLYGTQWDWDDAGQLSPVPLEDPEGVDARREAMGLGPLAAEFEKQRRLVAESGEKPPADAAARKAAYEAWVRKTGWRS